MTCNRLNIMLGPQKDGRNEQEPFEPLRFDDQKAVGVNSNHLNLMHQPAVEVPKKKKVDLFCFDRKKVVEMTSHLLKIMLKPLKDGWNKQEPFYVSTTTRQLDYHLYHCASTTKRRLA